MQDDLTPPGTPAPSLSTRAVWALASTQGWARFCGVGLFGVALLKAVQTGVALTHLPGRLNGQPVTPAMGHAAMGGIVFAGLVTIAVYCILGGLALRYAERLNYIKPPRRPEPGDIARALGAQHRYWRFQGILLIVGVALFLLVIAGAFAVGVMIAAAHH